MGTTLTGTTPQDTYDSLIKVTDNGPISGTAKFLSDGLGNDSVLALSTTAVGIGTATPSQLFQVQKNSAAVYSATTPTFNTIEHIRNATSGTGANSILNFTSEPNGEWYIGCVNKATFADFVFASRDAAYGERMRITSAGNVGIGISAPTALLHLEKPSQDNVLAVVGQDTYEGALFLSSAGSGKDANIVIGNSRSLIFYSTANSTPAARGTRILTIDSQGIKFGTDTAAANALDDYEEGTWTMGVAFGGASVGVTTSANTGTYTKIGRQVTANGLINLTSKGSSTGLAKITGLPFAIGAGGSNYSAISLRFDNITFANQFQAYGEITETTIGLEEITVLGARTTLTDADFANNSSIIMSFTYFV